jgi:hypothetical protein
MKIDELRIGYILPGHQPDIDEAPRAETPDQELEPSFSDRLHALQMPKMGDWKQVLRLTQQSPSLIAIDPPPRPAGLNANGPMGDNAEWRSFLSRYGAQPGLADDSHPVQRMMDVLAQFQRSTDMVRAKALERGRP